MRARTSNFLGQNQVVYQLAYFRRSVVKVGPRACPPSRPGSIQTRRHSETGVGLASSPPGDTGWLSRLELLRARFTGGALPIKLEPPSRDLRDDKIKGRLPKA